MTAKLYAQHPKKHSNAGFTLMEIIIATVLLGVVGSLGLNSYNKVVKQGQCRYIQNRLINQYNDRIVQIAQGKYDPIASNGNYIPNPNIVSPLSESPFIIFLTAGDDDNATGWTRLFTSDYNCTVQFSDPLSSTNPSCSGTGAIDYCSPIINP